MSIRGNLRYDIGYTGVNSTNSAPVVEGMFFPQRFKKCSKKKGLCSNETLEQSLFKNGCTVIIMSQEVAWMDPFYNDRDPRPFFARLERET